MSSKRIKLGQKVRDRFTGMEGVAVGRPEWLYGCVRVIVQPANLKDGVPVEEVVSARAAKRAKPAHGPYSSDPGRPEDRRA